MSVEQISLPIPGISGWLNRVFILRNQLESALDGSFEGVDVPPGFEVVLYNEVDAGLGDVAFATKLMRILRASLPNVGVTLVTTGPEKQARFGLPDGVRMFRVDEFASRTDGFVPSLVVSAPGIFDHCRKELAVLSALKLPAGTPFLYMAEYGSIRQLRDDAFKASKVAIDDFAERCLEAAASRAGFAPDDVGYRASTGDIVAVEGGTQKSIGHLIEGFMSLAPENPIREWVAAPSLRARSCGLEPGEIGVHIDEDLCALSQAVAGDATRSAEILEQLEDAWLREVLLASHNRAALYMGYAHSGYDFFVDYVAIIEAGRARDIEIVLPSARTVSQIVETDLNPDVTARLRSYGIGGVDVVGNTDGPNGAPGVGSSSLEFGPGKRMRLISRYPLQHRDMRRLLVVSQAPTIVSGDQSFSDAVSADKAIIFIEPVYCQTFHLDAVCALASLVAPSARVILDFGMRYAWSEGGYEDVARLLASPETMAGFRAINEVIRRHHNLNPSAAAVITRHLLANELPAIGHALSDVVSAALASASGASGVCLSAADLQRLSDITRRGVSELRSRRPRASDVLPS